MNKKELEESLTFSPRYNEDGLIPCITICAKSGDVLMFAYMNDTALNKSIETGEAHYWSRSRQELWHKGATSGLTQKIVEMRTDCDQDCILIKVEIGNSNNNDRIEASCHTGRKSCFYREIKTGSKAGMHFIDADKIFDPDDVY